MGTNREHRGLAVAMVVAVAAVLVAVNGKERRFSSDAAQGSGVLAATNVARAGISGKSAVTPALSASNVTLPDLVGDPSIRPTVERVRAEVAANPHATPMVLVDFASKMASMMKVAMISTDAAQQAAFQLDQCMQGDRSQWIDSARALCLVNYRRLAHAHPELKDRFLSARDSVEPRVAQLVRQMDALSH